MPTIPVNDLARHYQSIAEEIDLAVARVLSSGWYILGQEVTTFEKQFAAYCGVEHCIGVGNGTDALELALRALDVGPGDEVITVANAGMFSTVAILALGAQPRYVDVEPATMTLDASALAEAITDQTRAVIITHLYGQIADVQRALQVASEAGIPVLEDCAQAHGARLRGRHAGSWGAVAAFSFYPAKNLGAFGDGGAVITSDPDLAQKLRARQASTP
jgi:dTDP-4-amino-4,6-dideoxygalactose transaminase